MHDSLVVSVKKVYLHVRQWHRTVILIYIYIVLNTINGNNHGLAWVVVINSHMCCFAALCYAIPTPHAIFGKATWYKKFRSIITDVWLITGKCMFGSRAIRICIAMLPCHIEGDYLYNHPKPVFMEERTGFCGPSFYCQTIFINTQYRFFISSRHPPLIILDLS